MKRTKTPSFSLALKLNTSLKDVKVLNDRFFIAFLMTNRLVSHVNKALNAMRQDKEYRKALHEYLSLKGKDDPISKHNRNVLGEELSRIRLKYGLSEYQFHDWISVQQHRYVKYIDSFTAQKIATHVWESTNVVLFKKGKKVHYQKLDSLYSLEGKTNSTGIRFADGKLKWNKLIIQPAFDKHDRYEVEALTHRVKYCRIKRMAMGKSYHYYLELILEGTPPQKHPFKDGRVGLDQGTSSEAVFSENGCILTELAPERADIEKQVSRLQRKLDRSRRATNPDNYDPDGTVKKRRNKWVRSKTYKTTQMKLKTLRRRNAATVKQSEEIFANRILEEHGSDITTEKMDYKALQLRAKETKTTKAGRYASKKRFGKSLSKHAPAKFLSILERKLRYINKSVNYVDTWKFKASQYDHVIGDHQSSSLSSRSKMIGEHLVQRDLYSAFLLWAAKDETTVDRTLCFEYFPLFLSYQSTCIAGLKENTCNLSSFGLKDFG